jgi:hypothetical protein
MSVFVGQSNLQLKLDTGISLAGATSMKILWTDPNGNNGEWIVNSIDTTKLVYSIGAEDVSTPGTWKFQAYVVNGGPTAYGNIVTQKFDQIL